MVRPGEADGNMGDENDNIQGLANDKGDTVSLTRSKSIRRKRESLYTFYSMHGTSYLKALVTKKVVF